MNSFPSQNIEVPEEKRFPLDLSITCENIRSLYEESKLARWNPSRDIPWSNYDFTDVEISVKDAARTSWSRRVWTEHTKLSETPAVIIRLCLEAGREADPKYYLSVRGTEEAWHIETFLSLCSKFGGLVGQPENAEYAKLYSQNLYKMLLDKCTHVDAYLAAEGACRDTIELEIYRHLSSITDHPLVKSAIEKVFADKVRHERFSWMYISERECHWDSEDRRRIKERITNYIENIQLQGFHFAWLAKNNIANEVVICDEITAEHGLGAIGTEDEITIAREVFATLRERYQDLKIDLPIFRHDLLGAF